MQVEQLYTGCLAQGAYYIESNGEAAIIDPLREVQQYIDLADDRGATIKYIFETHFHADFVSGHVTLAEKTGAPIIYGPNANPKFDVTIATDGQVFPLGEVSITALHTPGHTMESTCYLLKDNSGKDEALFSGDTLFLGDVGRPDLAQKATSMTQEQLAGLLFDSLRTKIMPLADDVTVYPGHGAGSACGKNMMKETVDTLGNQKGMNYALRADMTKEEFVKELTDGLAPPPAYFPLNVKMNIEGYDSIDNILAKGTKPLDVASFEAAAKETNAVILDVRHQKVFVEGFIPGSIFIGIGGGFAPWVGAILKDVTRPILLVTEPERVEEVVTRLARVGFDNTLGYLEGGFETWKDAGKAVDVLPSIEANEMKAGMEANNGYPVIDVRNATEFGNGHVAGAQHFCLSGIEDSIDQLPQDQACYLHCAGGYRSVIAASLLRAKGLTNMIDIKGGFGAIKRSAIKIEVPAEACNN